jgi:hypothetical protein
MGESDEGLRNWHGLYRAALFEADANKLPTRIEEARRALADRARGLVRAPPIVLAKHIPSRMPSMSSTP